MASRPRRSLPVRHPEMDRHRPADIHLTSICGSSAYRFVNPPITLTQAGDAIWGNGLTRAWMPIERMDRDMVRAVIAGEDSKFCSHNGFDSQAIEAAMRRNASGGHVLRGGSTISQQTAKNVFLWQGGGYFRKGLEAWFTLLIENLWDKRRIMEVYLNVAETGIGTYGVECGRAALLSSRRLDPFVRRGARIAGDLPLPSAARWSTGRLHPALRQSHLQADGRVARGRPRFLRLSRSRRPVEAPEPRLRPRARRSPLPPLAPAKSPVQPEPAPGPRQTARRHVEPAAPPPPAGNG
jgi:monofunctional biosynthetic peptidoglycan transglycosylase